MAGDAARGISRSQPGLTSGSPVQSQNRAFCSLFPDTDPGVALRQSFSQLANAQRSVSGSPAPCSDVDTDANAGLSRASASRLGD